MIKRIPLFVVIVTALIFLVATAAAIFAPESFDFPGRWCGPNTIRIVCYRDWLGSLNGYVAAAVAAVTLLYLYEQVGQQAQQIAHQVLQTEQQTAQTAFLLGDADPTLDAYAEGSALTYLRVVNWNRRTLLIDKIECYPEHAIKINSVRLEHRLQDEVLPDRSPDFFPKIRVAAYDDRSKAPAICRINLYVVAQGPSELMGCSFALHGRLLGDYHRKITLLAKAEVLTCPADRVPGG